jgi:hypothetical protein
MFKTIICFALMIGVLSAQENKDSTKLKYELIDVPAKKYAEINGKKIELKPQALVKRYSLGMSNYGELAELINISLTEEGRSTYISRMNSILVIDQIEGHNRVIQVLNETQEEAYNIHVEVNYRNTKSLSKKGIIINTGPIIIDNGDIKTPRDIRIDGGVHKQTSDESQKITLTTMSGYAAKLWAVETAHYTEAMNQYTWINHRTRRPVQLNEHLRGTTNVGTELYIKPKYRGKGIIEVELVPMIRVKKPGGGYDKFEVQTLTTKVTAYQGRPISLGGVSKKTNDFFASLFNPTGIVKGDGTNYLDFTLTAWAKKVGPPQR